MLTFVVLLVLETIVARAMEAQTLTVLYTFTGLADGNGPSGGLVMDASGNLYGTAQFGGDLNCQSGLGCGTVFKLDTSGNLTVLHRFEGGSDGIFPPSGLFRDKAD